MSTGYEWLRKQEEDGTLAFLLREARAPWRFVDVARVDHAAEIDMGEGEKRVACIVRCTDNRRYELRAWRRADGTLEKPESMQLPGPI